MSFEREKQRRPNRTSSISFSLAYVRVMEWANDTPGAFRPKPDTLQKALEHAKRMGDDYIVQKIHEAYAIWENLNETPTPRDLHPMSTFAAEAEAERITGQIRFANQVTKPYSLSQLTEAERLDLELDLFLQIV